MPGLKLETINIGNRQKGRICAESVIHYRPEKSEIIDEFDMVCSIDYKEKLQQIKNPYESNSTSIEIIKQTKLYLDTYARLYMKIYYIGEKT